MRRLFCYHAAMRILTEIGEIGIHIGEETYILRPSLYAMSRLGEPKEIIEYFAILMSEFQSPADLRHQKAIALMTLYECMTTDADMSGIFGYYGIDSGFVAGSMPEKDILPLARCLIKHGVSGALPALKKIGNEPEEYMQEFVSRDHVALAMAHLGMTESDAWNMTMTSFIGALRAKFPQVAPDTVSGRAPSQEQTKATMDWFAKIEAKRKKKSGVH